MPPSLRIRPARDFPRSGHPRGWPDPATGGITHLGLRGARPGDPVLRRRRSAHRGRGRRRRSAARAAGLWVSNLEANWASGRFRAFVAGSHASARWSATTGSAPGCRTASDHLSADARVGAADARGGRGRARARSLRPARRVLRGAVAAGFAAGHPGPRPLAGDVRRVRARRGRGARGGARLGAGDGAGALGARLAHARRRVAAGRRRGGARRAAPSTSAAPRRPRWPRRCSSWRTRSTRARLRGAAAPRARAAPARGSGRAVPAGRRARGAVPGARLLPLDGDAHPPWHGHAASVVAPALAFLAGGDDRGAPPVPAAAGDLSDREREILRLVATGLSDARSRRPSSSARTPSTGTSPTSARSCASRRAPPRRPRRRAGG